MVRAMTALRCAFFAIFVAACSSGSSGSGDMSGPAPVADIMSACINVCGCFTKATEINDCRDLCNKMTTAGSIKVSRAFSGGSASFAGSTFWYSAAHKGHLASTGCLSCLSGASCTTLEAGTACLNECVELIPNASGQ
jgi:hypothetical protein